MPFWKRKPVVSGPTNVQGNFAPGNMKFQEVKRAYESAMLYGGHPTMPFAQGMSFVRDVWRPIYSGTGICQAVVNYWLADHAAGGSVWNRLFHNGGQINVSALHEMAHQQNAFGQADAQKTDSKVLQKQRSAAFLAGRGLIERKDVASAKSTLVTGNRANSSDPTLGRRIAESLCYSGMGNAPGGSYRMLNFTSTGGVGHVTCAWVQKDIMFFDPNYGEFWFETKDKFVTWFEKFWAADSYQKNFDGFEIRDYANKA